MILTIVSQYDNAYMYEPTPKAIFEADFMKKLSNTEVELKKSFAYKKRVLEI